jgi:hypothetical protein
VKVTQFETSTKNFPYMVLGLFKTKEQNSNSCESAARRRHPTRFASLIKEKHLIGSKVIKFRPSGFFSAKM